MTFCMVGNFACFFLSIDFFLIITFFKKKNRNTIRVLIILGPDQARQFVEPDLGPNFHQQEIAGRELNTLYSSSGR